MSYEVAQPTEQDLSRSTSIGGTKRTKPAALDTSTYTDTPHPPSSSTQPSTHNTATTEGTETATLTNSQHEKDLLQAPEGKSDAPKKTIRGLLHVPSRSSSHKIETSPTSTGLSGITATDPRESLGGQSKGSRRRNGSASSSKMSITPPDPSTGPAGNPNSTSSATARQPKKKSLLSFLCCGVPEENSIDSNHEALSANKVTKIPSNRPTTASKPDPSRMIQQNAAQPQTEKEALQQDDAGDKQLPVSSEAGTSANGELNRLPGDARDQPLPDLPTEENTTAQISRSGPSVVSPEASVGAMQNQTIKDDEEGDVIIDDSAPAPEKEEAPIPVPSKDETVNRLALLPPPPAPLLRSSTETVPPEPVEPKQQWLLPPIAPRFQGKKCLVLDLDETLVHSSFKILHQADFTIPVEIEGQYHNVYVIKRPGVDQFMKRVGELYEVVVFTASVSKYGDPLLDQLDIHHVVHHRLFRESCYNHQGNYVKDLSQVGRDLRETIIIDNSPTSYIFHPQHAVPISSWFSDAHDNELLDLIPVLEDLAGSHVRDVSLVLDVAL
ncbi:hypothetical protein B7494_g897 [Chlorociboria aeruginascens]|nr:hypothetical protein B7494_g897 [Chlorociboria aeruginascens]